MTHLVGADHPHKRDAQRALERLVIGRERHGIERILSFDAGFDGLPGIERLSA